MAIPSFNDVPEHWKHPIGPYRQAPAEYGGRYWLVNPFTTDEPWLTQGAMPNAPPLPDGFEAIFGPEPKAADFMHAPSPSLAARQARDHWLQDLKYFKSAGPPEWLEESQEENINQTFHAWDMGIPRYYNGRYGHMGRFSDSAIRDFEAPAWTCLNGAHQLISGYQMRMIEMGQVPAKRHPFVPPHIWPQAKTEE